MYLEKIWILVTAISGLADYSFFPYNNRQLECLQSMNPRTDLLEQHCVYRSLLGQSSIIEYSIGTQFLAKIINSSVLENYRYRQELQNICEKHFPNQRINTTSIFDQKKINNELNDICDDFKCWKSIKLLEAQILLVRSDSQIFLKAVQSSGMIFKKVLAIIELMILMWLALGINIQNLAPPYQLIFFSLTGGLLVENHIFKVLIANLINLINKLWLRNQILIQARLQNHLKQSRYHCFIAYVSILIELNSILVMLDQTSEGYPLIYTNPIDRLDLTSNTFIFVMILHHRLYKMNPFAKLQMHLSLRKIFLILSIASNESLIDSTEIEYLYWLVLLMEYRKANKFETKEKYRRSISNYDTETSDMIEVNQLL